MSSNCFNNHKVYAIFVLLNATLSKKVNNCLNIKFVVITRLMYIHVFNIYNPYFPYFANFSATSLLFVRGILI
jgi:hypothetical protein